MNLEEAKKILNSAGDIIIVDISTAMESNTFSYETFGKAIEPYALDSLEKIFIETGHNNFKRAKDKNEFPDLEVKLSDGNLAIDLKSGNHFKKSSGRWISCNNSNNDLGTLRAWPKKIQNWGAENIFFVFIEYSITNTTQKVEDVKIAPFYKFLEINTAGVLKYRKKDGHLRPKDFDAPSRIVSFKQFDQLFETTVTIRAKSIIREHIETIPRDERNSFLDELKSS